jgi:hypothetical protein
MYQPQPISPPCNARLTAAVEHKTELTPRILGLRIR